MPMVTAPPHSFHSYGLPVPVVAGSAHSSTQNDTFRSALVCYIPRRCLFSVVPTGFAQISFAGALCLCIIAAGYASPDALKTSRLLGTAVACGIIGCFFTVIALSLDRQHGGQWFLSLTLLSAAVGTVTMVAATQPWEFAVVTGLCSFGTAGILWRLRAYVR